MGDDAPVARVRVLHVGHDASRTGAPTVLRSLLAWARDHDEGVEPSVLLLRGGPLVEDLTALAPTRVAGPARSLVPAGGAPVAWAGSGRRADVVVANTLAALPAAAAAAGRRAGLVAHVHELDGVAGRILGPDGLGASLRSRVDRWVAVGPAVATMLVDRLAVPAERVVVVDAFVDLPTPGAPTRPSGLAAGPLVVGVGEAGPRKGTDVFLDVVGTVLDHPSAPVAAWLGGTDGTAGWAEAGIDVAPLPADRVVVRATAPDVLAVVAGAAVLLAPAREDPFPLAVLEAAALDIPVVAFDGGGAAAALRAADQADAVVAAGDGLALCRALTALLDDPAAAGERGRALGRWVRTTHLTEHLAPRVWAAVREVAR